jgi:hypothetical protein
LNPGSQTVVRRRSSHYPGDGTEHVTVEEIVAGSLQVTSRFVAPANVEVTDPAPAAAGSAPGASAGPMSVPCPGNLVNEVNRMIPRAAANGGRCLRIAGMSAEVAVIATVSTTRTFNVMCEQGSDRRAGIDTDQAADPMRSIDLSINVDHWNNFSVPDLMILRELIIFHELLHTALGGHDPALENLRKTNDPRWREVDRVSACNSLCYNPGVTRCECATCLRKTICDAPCSSQAACFTSQRGGWCDCPNANPPRHEWFDSITACTVDCPRGLGCAFVLCRPEMNACK